MTIGQRAGAVVVALFAVVFTRTPGVVRLLNPLMRRLLASPLPMGPNALLRVRGRKTGRLRSFPVAFLEVDGRALLQASSARDAWVVNLRAAGEAEVVRGRRRDRYFATELEPEAAGAAMHELVAGLPRSRLVRAVVGPTARPPVAILRSFRIRVDDCIDAYVASARRQPVFELRALGR